ncbi:MAG: putative motility protein [Clostridium sp.]|nr:putative motility protein [Clostridium sp.]
MDIAGLSVVMSQYSVQSQVGVALTKMTMENMKNTASNLNEMMGSIAVNPNVGKVIDVSV